MKTIAEFKASFHLDQAPSGLSPQLKSLWFDGKGVWQQAHAQVDHLNDPESAWVHAYLHREEGDIGNADYWYRKVRRACPNISLEKEWAHLVLKFL